MYTLFHLSVFHYFGGPFSEGLRKKPAKKGCNERQTAHKGERQNGVNTCHLHNKWRASTSNVTRKRHHTHSAISERRKTSFIVYQTYE